MKIFSGESNKKLATKICEHLGVPMGEIFHHTFPSNEKFCQFKENIRGEDIFLIQSTSKPSNDNLMQLLIMIDAAKRASAGRITAVIPNFGYARQDRKEDGRVPISAKLVMNMLEAAGANRILTMDLHAQQITGFTDLPCDHLRFSYVLKKYIEMFHSKENLVIVAPDIGAIKNSQKYSKAFGCGFAVAIKERLSDTEVKSSQLIGNVEGKTAILIDDLTESCGTLIGAAEICRKNGAKEVHCAVSHFCITDVGMSRLVKNLPHPNVLEPSIIDSFIHSDSVDVWWELKYKPEDIIELSVAELFASAILKIHRNESVSELF